MATKAITTNCIKCGGICDVVGMEATNRTVPGAKVRMVRCTCRDCGFMEIRMDDKGLAQVMENGRKD